MLPQGGTTTHGGTTGGGGSSGAEGEEPDVASPRKQLQRRRAPDSDGEVSDQSLAAQKGSSRMTPRDPLASWFAAHFAALEKKGALHSLSRMHRDCVLGRVRNFPGGDDS